MTIEIVDREIPTGAPAAATPSHGRLTELRSASEAFDLRGAPVAKDRAADGVGKDVIAMNPRGGRVLAESTKQLLENIDKHGTAKPDESSQAAGADPAAAAPSPSSPGLSPAPDAAAAPAPPAPAEAPAPAAAPATAPAADHAAENARLVEHNRRLVAELEAARKQPAPATRGEPSAREKALDDAERGYLDDSIGSVRRFVATALGIDDPASEAVTREIKFLYQDLTQLELGVALGPEHQAAKEAARTRMLLERDKRDRKAETVKPSAATDPGQDVTAAREAAAVPVIADHFVATKHAEKFPLLMKLAPKLDGMPPEKLVWKLIERGIQTGEVARNDPDDKLIEYASNLVENHYKALRDEIAPASAPSTATPAQAGVTATDQKAQPTSQGPRTVTNASASVAPATLPAATTPATTEQPKPKFRNEKERREFLVAKHFGDS